MKVPRLILAILLVLVLALIVFEISRTGAVLGGEDDEAKNEDSVWGSVSSSDESRRAVTLSKRKIGAGNRFGVHVISLDDGESVFLKGREFFDPVVVPGGNELHIDGIAEQGETESCRSGLAVFTRCRLDHLASPADRDVPEGAYHPRSILQEEGAEGFFQFFHGDDVGELVSVLGADVDGVEGGAFFGADAGVDGDEVVVVDGF